MPDSTDVPQQTCPSCGTVVNVADLEPLVNVACPACDARFRVERAFDNFVVVETLGVGGMGFVYKARDTRLDRFVALKLLRRELSADPAEAARLEQEARVTAAVNHPNVVQVYSTGTDHGQIYLVMELVEHGSLDDLMTETPRLPEAQVLETGIQVAKGLQAAEQKGLIHRDVKPANILFADARTAKIGDFGLAVAAEQKTEAQREIWGTPYYVAPERLNNEPEDVRSDIYSLGATLFHALAGRPPIEGESTSASELRRLKSEPPDLQTIAPDVSRATARIVNTMLAPAPADRFASYADLIAALQAAAGVSATSKRRGWWPIALAALTVAVVAGGGIYVAQLRKVPTESSSEAAGTMAAIEGQYQDARRQIIEGQYDVAAANFTRLAADIRTRQPLLNWIRLHAGVAALLQGQAGPAREMFAQIARTAAASNSSGEAALAKFFAETGRQLSAADAMPPPTPLVDPKGPESFRAFAGGLKDWQLSKFTDAAALFTTFIQAEPAADYAWIGDYKPIAQKYLNDYRAYASWQVTAQQFATTADVRTAIEKLRDVEKKLQTKGPLAEAIKADLKRLTAEAMSREKTEKQVRDEEHRNLLAAESPLWEAALAASEKHIGVYDFAGAVAELEAPQLSEPSLKQAQIDERKKVGWLQQWKAALIADINAGRFVAPVQVVSTSYEGAAKATEARISFRVPPYGTADVEWTKVPDETLLEITKALIQPNAPDAAERQWLAAVFAVMTAQPNAARELSDAAAKAKPEYKDDSKLLALPKQ